VESVSPRSELRALLEQIDEPCWVVDDSGRSRMVNAVAKKLFPVEPGFIAAYARGDSEDAPVGFRVRRVTLDGDVWSIVFGPRPDGSSDTSTLLGLEPSDAEIVDHLLRGFSDRELVLLTGRPMATIHAAIVRIYRSIGVMTRTELVAAVKRARANDLDATLPPGSKSDTVPRPTRHAGRPAFVKKS